MRASRAAGRVSVGFALLVPCLGCASYASLMHEFDGLVGYDSTAGREAAKFEVRDATWRVPSFLIRLDTFYPLLAFERELTAVERPRRLLRENLREMAERSSTNLDRIVEVLWRAVLILDSDRAPLDRATAVRVLSRLLERLPNRDRCLEAFVRPMPEGVSRVAIEDRARELVDGLTEIWPKDGALERTTEQRNAFVQQMRELAKLTAPSLAFERARLRVFREAMIWESDAAVQRDVATKLLGLCSETIASALHATLKDPSVVVRRSALDAVWKLGGADLSAHVIATLSQGNRGRVPNGAPGAGLVDEDPDVRRKLTRHFASVTLEQNVANHADAASPLAFLVDTSGRDPDLGLRLLARDALASLTGRTRDPSGAWIADWWKDFVAKGQPAARDGGDGK